MILPAAQPAIVFWRARLPALTQPPKGSASNRGWWQIRELRCSLLAGTVTGHVPVVVEARVPAVADAARDVRWVGACAQVMRRRPDSSPVVRRRRNSSTRSQIKSENLDTEVQQESTAAAAGRDAEQVF